MEAWSKARTSFVISPHHQPPQTPRCSSQPDTEARQDSLPDSGWPYLSSPGPASQLPLRNRGLLTLCATNCCLLLPGLALSWKIPSQRIPVTSPNSKASLSGVFSAPSKARMHRPRGALAHHAFFTTGGIPWHSIFPPCLPDLYITWPRLLSQNLAYLGAQ